MNSNRGKDKTRIKPAGQRIREICACLEEFGPMKAKEISQRLPHISPPNASEYCAIGVFDGYLTVEKSDKCCRPSTWTVKPNWKQLIAAHGKSKPALAEKPTRWTGVASVFQMGRLDTNVSGM